MADSRSSMEMGVTLTLFLLAWIALALRGWVRIKMLHTFGLDDYLMTAAMVCASNLSIELKGAEWRMFLTSSA